MGTAPPEDFLSELFPIFDGTATAGSSGIFGILGAILPVSLLFLYLSIGILLYETMRCYTN